jgi:hypothetical protein
MRKRILDKMWVHLRGFTGDSLNVLEKDFIINKKAWSNVDVPKTD